MSGSCCRLLACSLLILMSLSCKRGHADAENGDEDTLTSVFEDTTFADSLSFMEEEEVRVPVQAMESFGDFMFAFIHNTRFQAERIRFPLHVAEADGSERLIRSGKQFRSEFRLPGNEYYTMLLGDKSQISVLQNDSAVVDVDVQLITLKDLNMESYRFQRNNGRWFLTGRTDEPVESRFHDFFHFYHKFTTDSVFQQESLAEQLQISIPESDEEEDEEMMEGTISRDQWPVFRPELPRGAFANIYFGQEYPNPNHLILIQCGISNSMLDYFTFNRSGEQWQLTAYDN